MTALTEAQRRRLLDDANTLEHRANALNRRREYFLAGISYVEASDLFRRVGASRRNWARILLERAGVAFSLVGPSAEKHGIAAQAKWERLIGMEPEMEAA